MMIKLRLTLRLNNFLIDSLLTELFLSCYLFPSVPGWLDDIGLPQYKTQFDEGRVDGRMLHYMTVVSLFLNHFTRF